MMIVIVVLALIVAGIVAILLAGLRPVEVEKDHTVLVEAPWVSLIPFHEKLGLRVVKELKKSGKSLVFFRKSKDVKLKLMGDDGAVSVMITSQLPRFLPIEVPQQKVVADFEGEPCEASLNTRVVIQNPDWLKLAYIPNGIEQAVNAIAGATKSLALNKSIEETAADPGVFFAKAIELVNPKLKQMGCQIASVNDFVLQEFQPAREIMENMTHLAVAKTKAEVLLVEAEGRKQARQTETESDANYLKGIIGAFSKPADVKKSDVLDALKVRIATQAAQKGATIIVNVGGAPLANALPSVQKKMKPMKPDEKK